MTFLKKIEEQYRQNGLKKTLIKGGHKVTYTAAVIIDRLFDKALNLKVVKKWSDKVSTKYAAEFFNKQNINDNNYKHYVQIQLDKSFKNSSYIRFWRFWGRTGLIERLDQVLPQSSREDMSILCVGCRDSRELNNVKRMCRLKNITGLDLFSEDPRIKVGDMHAMPFDDNSFDVLISVDNLEHAYEPAKALSEFRRVVKKGGFIGIEVPINYTTNETDRHDYKSIENLAGIAGFKLPEDLVYEEELKAPVYQKIRVIFKNG